jgi:hypothetical protein
VSDKRRSTSLGRKESGETRRVIGKTTLSDGREVWRVASGTRITNLTTSASSTSIMDQAMVIYGRALKRLADR